MNHTAYKGEQPFAPTTAHPTPTPSYLLQITND